MNVDFLAPDEGMLFEWEQEGLREMWMKNTTLKLDQIGIDDNEEVVMVYTPTPESEELIPFPGCKYILEVNADSGIQVGDDVDIDDSEDYSKYVMKVLAPDGTTQMYLQGGERIVSRKETRVLIKKAKKADKCKSDEDLFNKACKSLGKYMFKILYGQDHRDAEYVQVPGK